MWNQSPPFKSLVAFEAAARLGNISRAADELSLTQSAVSQRVRKLEEFVGQSLFFRQGSGVSLTAAGELLYDSVHETLKRLSAGFDRIAPYKNKDSLLLACPPEFAHGWLMPRLELMKASHPSVEIWLISDRDVRAIDRVDVDLIVSRMPIHTADVECVPLLEDEAIAIAGARSGERLARLSFPKVLEKAPLLFLEGEPEWNGLLAEPRFASLRLTRGATIDDLRLLIDAVAQELGIALVPRIAAAQAIAQHRCRVLEQVPPVPKPRWWLMRSRLEPRTPFADIAFTWLRKAAAGG